VERHLPRGEISLAGACALCLFSGLGWCSRATHQHDLFLSFAACACSASALFHDQTFSDFTHVYLGIALALAHRRLVGVKGGFDFFPVENGWL